MSSALSSTWVMTRSAAALLRTPAVSLSKAIHARGVAVTRDLPERFSESSNLANPKSEATRPRFVCSLVISLLDVSTGMPGDFRACLAWDLPKATVSTSIRSNLQDIGSYRTSTHGPKSTRRAATSAYFARLSCRDEEAEEAEQADEAEDENDETETVDAVGERGEVELSRRLDIECER